MTILSALRDTLDHYRYRRRCENDAEAYERRPLTKAELAVGEDQRDWDATPSW